VAFKSILTIPNILTLIRLAALIPVIILFRQELYVLSSALFVIAMFTDAVDGYLAKKLNQATRFGLYLDPVVDKVVILVLFYEIAMYNKGFILLPLTVAHLFLLRELVQNGVRAVAAAGGDIVAANWMGKTKAVLQTVCIAMGLALPSLLSRFEFSSGSGTRMIMLYIGFTCLVLGLSFLFTILFIINNRTQILGKSPA